jgi:hypothetical protein
MRNQLSTKKWIFKSKTLLDLQGLLKFSNGRELQKRRALSRTKENGMKIFRVALGGMNLFRIL